MERVCVCVGFAYGVRTREKNITPDLEETFIAQRSENCQSITVCAGVM